MQNRFRKVFQVIFFLALVCKPITAQESGVNFEGISQEAVIHQSKVLYSYFTKDASGKLRLLTISDGRTWNEYFIGKDNKLNRINKEAEPFPNLDSEFLKGIPAGVILVKEGALVPLVWTSLNSGISSACFLPAEESNEGTLGDNVCSAGYYIGELSGRRGTFDPVLLKFRYGYTPLNSSPKPRIKEIEPGLFVLLDLMPKEQEKILDAHPEIVKQCTVTPALLGDRPQVFKSAFQEACSVNNAGDFLAVYCDELSGQRKRLHLYSSSVSASNGISAFKYIGEGGRSISCCSGPECFYLAFIRSQGELDISPLPVGLIPRPSTPVIGELSAQKKFEPVEITGLEGDCFLVSIAKWGTENQLPKLAIVSAHHAQSGENRVMLSMVDATTKKVMGNPQIVWKDSDRIPQSICLTIMQNRIYVAISCLGAATRPTSTPPDALGTSLTSTPEQQGYRYDLDLLILITQSPSVSDGATSLGNSNHSPAAKSSNNTQTFTSSSSRQLGWSLVFIVGLVIIAILVVILIAKNRRRG